jgi:hypothetical protein
VGAPVVAKHQQQFHLVSPKKNGLCPDDGNTGRTTPTLRCQRSIKIKSTQAADWQRGESPSSAQR